MTLDTAGDALIDMIVRTANGRLTAAEALGHREFVDDQALPERLIARCHSGAHAQRREPGIQSQAPMIFWIPGPALSRGPGMTAEGYCAPCRR